MTKNLLSLFVLIIFSTMMKAQERPNIIFILADDFTSDYGEMLGDHGLHSKPMFYEGAVNVSLVTHKADEIKKRDLYQKQYNDAI